MKKTLLLLFAFVLSIGTAWAQFAAPTTNPTEPTDKAARVIAVYSDHYNKGLTEGQYNSEWGGGPTANKWSSLTEQEIVDGHKVVHVVGYGFHNRTANSTALTSDYSIAHVAIYPKTATKFKIYADGGYSWANVVSDDAHPLTPGQWNYIEVSGVSLSTNFISIALWDSENNLETEFYLDHFYFAKPPIDDSVAPVLNTCNVASTNCVSATLTLKATDETSETVSYKITDTNSSTVYNTSGASGSEISYVIGGLLASTDYTFSITAEDENGNVSAAQNVVVSTTAYPPIPSSTIDESNVITIYGQYGTGVGAVFASGDANYDMNGRTVAKSSGNNSQFNLPSPGYDVSEMDYIHYDIMSDVDSPVALMVHNDGWKGIDIDGGLTAGEWKSFNVPISFFKDECGKTMDKVTMLCLIKNVADKTSHEGFGDFSKPYPTLYIANVYCYKESPSTKVTVSFKNSIGWESVNAFAWTDGGASYLGDYPGTPMTKSGDVYTITFDPGATIPEKIVFNNGGTGNLNQTADLAVVDGKTYDMGYFIAGTMNSWTEIDPDYVMTKNTGAATTEYQFGPTALTKDTELKAVLSRDGETIAAYYPDGTDNNYVVAATGNYTIYFRPNHDGGDDWYEKYIFLASVSNLVDEGATGKAGAHKLTGTWDGDEFATLDATAQATAYDVSGLATTFDGSAITTVKKNALFIARADQNIAKNKVVDNGDNTYTGTNIEILDYSEYNGLNTEMNTSISPITGPVAYHRVLPRAGIYLTQVVPFNVAVPSDCNAYEATTSTNNAGTITITFTEVNTLQAGVPYLMHATNGGVHFNAEGLDFSKGSDQALTDGVFKGTYAPINPVPANTYVMPKGDDAVNAEFRKASTGSYIPAFRAYIQLNTSGAKINVLFDDTTGIHAATAEQLEAIFNIYSIDGKLVRQNSDSKVGLEKGIYIINGKKVIVK